MKKLLENLKVLQVNFIIIYIIHKILELLKITRTLKCLLRSVHFFKKENNRRFSQHLRTKRLEDFRSLESKA